MQKNTNSTLIVIIAIVAGLALIIGWSAFNRSGEDVIPTAADEARQAANEVEQLGQRVANETEQAAAEVAAETRQATARAEARAELLALEARLEAADAQAEVAAEINDIERNLEMAYANASVEARAEFAELQTELQSLERSVRNGTGDTLEVFAGVLLLLENDARSDDDAGTEANASFNATTN